MSEPSQLVAQPLQAHLHLISGHRFPHLPSLSIDQALRYLSDAPTIVKQTAPMSWTYITAPQDGSAWLEWIPRRQNGEYPFASDGYLWADPEQTFRTEYGGYMIEYMQHQIGYRPNHDHTATHARTRYHFLQKSPGMNAPPPDPSLWIVHYHMADQSRMMPVAQIPIPQRMRQILNDRRWVEMQGRIERKDFMLHDREHWPTVNVPQGGAGMQHMQQPGMYQNPMMQQQQQQQQQMAGMQRFPQQAYPSAQGPPAKRPRHSGPSNMPGSSDGAHDASIEDDENTLMDYFDHLTPRDISLARYSQHHRWMEEVFSSVYASSQIVPPDLGLGLMGELKGLTDGILDPPSLEDTREQPEKPGQGKREIRDVQPFTNLRKDQVDEFNRRVEKHLADGQAEIERMKLEHAEKMAQWKKTKTLTSAEKRLRYATWEGHEDAVPVYRLEVLPAANGHPVEGEGETVEGIVKELEDVLVVKIQAQNEATMVQRGGLEEKEEPLQLTPDDQEMQGQDSTVSDTNGETLQPAFEQQNTTLSQQQTPPLQQQQQQLPDISQLQDSTPQPQHSTVPHDLSSHHDDISGMHDMDMGDTSLIDMDVDTGEIDFIEHDDGEEVEAPEAEAADDLFGAEEPEASVAAVREEGADGLVGGLDEQRELVEEIAAPTSAPVLEEGAEMLVQAPSAGASEVAVERQEAGHSIPAPAAQDESNEDVFALSTSDPAPALPEQEAPPTAEAEAPTALPEASAEEAAGDAGDTDLFDDTFDDLANMDDGHGDESLLDFDGMGGMEDSAFGDAMHGMEERTPLGEEEEEGMGM